VSDVTVISLGPQKTRYYRRLLRFRTKERPSLAYVDIQIGSEVSSVGRALNDAVQRTHGKICLFAPSGFHVDSLTVDAHLNHHAMHPRSIGIQTGEQLLAHGAPSLANVAGACISIPRSLILSATGFRTDLRYAAVSELVFRLMKQEVPLCWVHSQPTHGRIRPQLDQRALDMERRGAIDTELYACHPSTLPYSGLQNFNDGPLRAILLRRLFLALGLSARQYALLGRATHAIAWIDEWPEFLSSMCYWRGVKSAAGDLHTWKSLTCGVVILMYHAFAQDGERASQYVIPRRRFTQQMRWLQWSRRPVLRLEDLIVLRRQHRVPPPRSVVITFDDGYADNARVAWPILRRFGLSATIFVVTGLVDKSCLWLDRGPLAERPLLTWQDLRALIRDNIEIGGHTRNHSSLTDLSSADVREEIEGAKRDLEIALSTPITTMAYPNGKHDPVVERLVEEAGYSCAGSSHSGLNDPGTPTYALRRTEIRGTDSLLTFILASRYGKTDVFARLWEGR